MAIEILFLVVTHEFWVLDIYILFADQYGRYVFGLRFPCPPLRLNTLDDWMMCGPSASISLQSFPFCDSNQMKKISFNFGPRKPHTRKKNANEKRTWQKRDDETSESFSRTSSNFQLTKAGFTNIHFHSSGVASLNILYHFISIRYFFFQHLYKYAFLKSQTHFIMYILVRSS